VAVVWFRILVGCEVEMIYTFYWKGLGVFEGRSLGAGCRGRKKVKRL